MEVQDHLRYHPPELLIAIPKHSYSLGAPLKIQTKHSFWCKITSWIDTYTVYTYIYIYVYIYMYIYTYRYVYINMCINHHKSNCICTYVYLHSFLNNTVIICIYLYFRSRASGHPVILGFQVVRVSLPLENGPMVPGRFWVGCESRGAELPHYVYNKYVLYECYILYIHVIIWFWMILVPFWLEISGIPSKLSWYTCILHLQGWCMWWHGAVCGRWPGRVGEQLATYVVIRNHFEDFFETNQKNEIPLHSHESFPQNHRSSPSKYPLCQGHCGPAPVGSILHTCLVVQGCKNLHSPGTVTFPIEK